MTQLPPSGPPAFGLPSAGGAPVCPRHPDRESYIRCQRCDRPVCPECQRSAPVGFQCVDCVAAQAKTMRTARTTFGGQVQRGGLNATTALIGLCVAVYALQWLGGGAVTRQFMFVPAFAIAEPWTFLTAAFLHSPNFVLHIAFNMYALWLGGRYLESLLGRARFLGLYLLSAVGGSVGVFLLAVPGEASRSWWTGAVGASGAVFGLWGAIMVFNRRLGRDNGGHDRPAADQHRHRLLPRAVDRLAGPSGWPDHRRPGPLPSSSRTGTCPRGLRARKAGSRCAPDRISTSIRSPSRPSSERKRRTRYALPEISKS